jgi:hypothetical protein
MRADLIIDMDGKPGQTYRIVDDFYPDLAYKLVDLVMALHGQPEITHRAHRKGSRAILCPSPI